MKIREYLTNPAGKGSSIFGDQSAIQQRYEEEAQSLLESGKGVPNMYSLRNRYLIFYYQLQSKSGEKYGKELHYDILVLVDTKTVTLENSKIMDMDFKVFSNCPSFLYTYLNLFNKKDLLIDWTKKLYDKETLRKPAKTRNSYGIIGYERSLYITLLLIQHSYGSLYLVDLMRAASAISSTDTIIHMIQSQSQMKRNFDSAKDTYAYAKKLSESRSTQREKRRGEEFSDLTNSVKSVKKTKTTRAVKKSKKI